MRKLSFLLAFVLMVSPCFGAVAFDRRISDSDGDVADITADGKLSVSTTITTGSGVGRNTPDRRISDNDSQVADITSTGALRLSS